jgi:hypothetical protein
MNEVISGIRVIKMYAWENAFNKLISKLRRYICDVLFALLLCQSHDSTTTVVMFTHPPCTCMYTQSGKTGDFMAAVEKMAKIF